MLSVNPLAHDDFRWLLTGRTCGELGNAVAPVALAFAVLDRTGSAVDLGFVVGARSLASVLLVLFGGMLADRLPRSVILQGSELASALTQAVIAASVLCGFGSVPLLVALSLANGAVAAVSLPAASALTPQTVPENVLAQANAYVRIGANLGRFTGAAVGGVLVAGLGSGWAIAVNASLFLSAALSYRRIRVEPAVVPSSRPLAELAEGWREFSSRSWIWTVAAQFCVVNAVNAGAVQVLGPLIADHTIGRRAWGLILAAQTIGALAGGVLAARWQPRRALLVGVAVTFADVLPLVFLVQVPLVLPLLAAGFVNGVAIEVFTVAWDVSLQENVPADRLSRVYSYDLLGSIVALPVGAVAAGPLAARFGTQPVLLAGAAAIAVATAGALLNREIRILRRRGPRATPV
ncbi:MFS transporter [Amycolatopsis bartoniae]|uniref:MFS transporter n=1 Tax=Amycolatopsis bartoniae TaxID=941986 RepID=UPI001E4318AB|nr:MFS transporter [Amycolatopsis bartoniae]